MIDGENGVSAEKYPEGLFPLIRDLIKGRRDVCWIGFECGLIPALFLDWGE